jgi:glycosyltransferase involved in cell wall biosynthesis
VALEFSIVTPSFRNSEWLKLCVASVADQGVELEHIIQDGGSDDGTLDWLLKDRRVRVFVEPDAGMYDAINRGFRKARGQFIAHLNCDEQYLPGALQAVRSYFQQHPEVDVVFADVVIVDPEGRYRWHRKVLTPQRWHTAVCPLATLTCATFFRRHVIEARPELFDPRWRYCGDSAMVLGLLQDRVPMGVLRRFTSAFTHTGQNLSLKPEAQAEARSFFAQAPVWVQRLRPLILLQHRLRRLLAGVYWQRPFDFAIYTRLSPTQRVVQHVTRPTCRWQW